MGFFCSIADSSLFICHSTCCTILLLLYVDGILLTGNNFFYLLQFIILLGRKFAMKDLGPFHYFLGVKVQYFDGGLFLNQTKCATELLHRAQDLGPVSCVIIKAHCILAFGYLLPHLCFYMGSWMRIVQVAL